MILVNITQVGLLANLQLGSNKPKSFKNKNMKKIIFSAVVIIAVNTASAQTYVTGGVNLSNISIDNDGKTEENNALTSFNVGLLHQFDLSRIVDVELGLLLTGKGARAETNFTNNDFNKTKFNPLYLEVPLNALIKITDVNKNGIFFHAGPYVAMGVAGKSTTERRIGIIQSNSTSDIEFNNDNPFTNEQEGASYNKLKRFDYGLNAGLGIGGKNVMLRFNYGLGLAKINSTQNNNSLDDKNKYRVFSLNLAIGLN